MEVDVSVTERAAGGSVTADTHRGNWSDVIEDFEQKGLSYVVVEVTDVKGCRSIRGSSSRSRSSHFFVFVFLYFF